MTRCLIVIGAEATGTRATTRLLVEAGCAGTWKHAQPFDHEPPDAKAFPLAVWRKSVPHGHQWPDVAAMVERLQGNGYEDITVVVAVRDWHVTKRSQVRARHVKTLADAEGNMRKAYTRIFAGLVKAGVPYVISSLEALEMHGRKASRGLLQELGITKPAKVYAFKDANAKYYQGTA